MNGTQSKLLRTCSLVINRQTDGSTYKKHETAIQQLKKGKEIRREREREREEQKEKAVHTLPPLGVCFRLSLEPHFD